MSGFMDRLKMGRGALVALGAFAAIAGASLATATPALADNGRHHGWDRGRHNGWEQDRWRHIQRDRWRDARWRNRAYGYYDRVYYPPPPPVYYYPPRPYYYSEPSLSLGFSFR